VVDFGIAKLRETAMHTMTGTVLGTPAYMSYEQASGLRSDELDARSDIYSLGVVVYEMLTGRLPFHSDTPAGYLRKHLMEGPPPFRAVDQSLNVSPAVESVVMKALTKERKQRYSSVLEFAQEFSLGAEASSPPAIQPEPQREATKPQTTVTLTPKTVVSASVGDTVTVKAVPESVHRSRRKWLVVVSIVFILGVATAGFWYWERLWYLSQPSPKPQPQEESEPKQESSSRSTPAPTLPPPPKPQPPEPATISTEERGKLRIDAYIGKHSAEGTEFREMRWLFSADVYNGSNRRIHEIVLALTVPSLGVNDRAYRLSCDNGIPPLASGFCGDAQLGFTVEYDTPWSSRLVSAK
jgi:serine/threonine protein kinase